MARRDEGHGTGRRQWRGKGRRLLGGPPTRRAPRSPHWGALGAARAQPPAAVPANGLATAKVPALLGVAAVDPAIGSAETASISMTGRAEDAESIVGVPMPAHANASTALHERSSSAVPRGPQRGTSLAEARMAPAHAR